MVNNYSIYEADIKPKGFKVIEFDGFISNATLAETRYVLMHPEESAERAEHNYNLARWYYSYTMLEPRLQLLLSDCFSETMKIGLARVLGFFRHGVIAAFTLTQK